MGIGTKLYTITVTRNQFDDLSARLDDYYERLADITEHPPQWLRQTLEDTYTCPDGPVRIADVDCALQRALETLGTDHRNILMFVQARREESGLLTEALL